MGNKNVAIGVVAVIIILAVIGWYSGWFGADKVTAPELSTEQPATTEEPATSEEPAAN